MLIQFGKRKSNLKDLLSHVTLGGGVERSQLYCFGILWSHLKQYLFKGVELAPLSVHIILVHLESGDRVESNDRIRDNKTVG